MRLHYSPFSCMPGRPGTALGARLPQTSCPARSLLKGIFLLWRCMLGMLGMCSAHAPYGGLVKLLVRGQLQGRGVPKGRLGALAHGR